MPTIQEIYKKYKIMPNLQEHQLRVTGVAKLICDNFKIPIKKDMVVKACLVHDMGNILKFNLPYFPEFLEPKGLKYWEKVQRETAEKYQTNDEHIATKKIAEELKVKSEILKLLDSFGFLEVTNNMKSDNFEDKICCYADLRVDPFGVVSIEGRLNEGQKRYQDRPHSSVNSKDFNAIYQDLKILEEQIFEKTLIKPEEINNEKVRQIIQDFKSSILP